MSTASLSVFQNTGILFYHENNFIFSTIDAPKLSHLTQFELLVKDRARYIEGSQNVADFILSFFNASAKNAEQAIEELIDAYINGNSLEATYNSFKNVLKAISPMLLLYQKRWFIHALCRGYVRKENLLFHKDSFDFCNKLRHFIDVTAAKLVDVKLFHAVDSVFFQEDASVATILEFIEYNPFDELETCIEYFKDILALHMNFADERIHIDTAELLFLYTKIYAMRNDVPSLQEAYEAYLPHLSRTYTNDTIGRALLAYLDDGSKTEEADLKTAIQKAKPDNKTFTGYFENLQELIFLLLYLTLSDVIYIKICKNCGRYFLAPKRNVDYCLAKIPDSDKTCKDIGASRQYEKKLSVPKAKYRSLYKNICNRIKNCPNPVRAQKWKNVKLAFSLEAEAILTADKTDNEKVNALKELYKKLKEKYVNNK